MLCIMQTMSLPAIRLLETDANKRGNLFTKLVTDLFIALGYENPRQDIHKGGYELDVKADHAADKSLAVAECKATVDLPGGTDLNKFLGVLDAEVRSNAPRLVTGYFVSLFGFKQSGIEAEQKFSPPRFTLLDGNQVVDHLIRGQRLCDHSVATDQAGRCVGKNHELSLDPARIVLAHEHGLFWAVCYRRGAVRSHVVLVAADGTPAQAELAKSLLEADKICGRDLHQLACLNPDVQLRNFSSQQVFSAREAWRKYLDHECGSIGIEGIASDQDVSSRRFRLEDLFVPQRLLIKTGDDKSEKTSVADALFNHPQLAILAAPGGGKSTLLKRLAVAYADPARRSLVSDQLPDRDWFPIFLRCRELRDLARRPLGIILKDLAQKDHLSQHSDVFLALAQDALQRGTALLLVDGLDEISDDATRTALVCTLRAALDVWPQTRLVVTSREAGFRHVAPHLAPFCQQAVLATLNQDDIRTLSARWHVQVEGDIAEVRQNAKTLAERIISNDRVSQLAGNPLLLTTLFLVKRQTGDLPTGRAKLYGEAVKVLLWSWNAEGFTDRINLDDAEPRLAWVAYDMMQAGTQRISRPKLRASLQAANIELENTFGLSRLDPVSFIDRIEYRSSLLMMTGKDTEDDQIVDFYEFRHLTFQEYLAARACVEGWHAGGTDCDTLADVLQPHLEDEKWKEVIPLAAVLGGKQTSALLTLLIDALKDADPNEQGMRSEMPQLVLLIQCLADEAPASPTLVEHAARCLLAKAWWLPDVGCIEQFWRGRHGQPVRSFVATQLESSEWAVPAVHVLSSRIEGDMSTERHGAPASENFRTITKRLADSDPDDDCLLLQQKIEAGLLAMTNAFHLHRSDSATFDHELIDAMQACQDQLCASLWSEHPAEQYVATWAFNWFLACDSLPTRVQRWLDLKGEERLPLLADVVGRLALLALNAPHPWTRRCAAFALAKQPLVIEGRSCFCSTIPDELEISPQILEQSVDSHIRELASIIVAWYRRKPHTDAELLKRAEALLKVNKSVILFDRRIQELIHLLGGEPKAEG